MFLTKYAVSGPSDVVVLCAKLQNLSAAEMDVIHEWDFAVFEFRWVLREYFFQMATASIVHIKYQCNSWCSMLTDTEIQANYHYSRIFLYRGPFWYDIPYHDDVIKWKQFPRYRPIVRGIHWSPVNSPHKGQWCGALVFSLISAWINGWVNIREAGDFRRHCAHYDVIEM